jgi:hypothetical protein
MLKNHPAAVLQRTMCAAANHPAAVLQRTMCCSPTKTKYVAAPQRPSTETYPSGVIFFGAAMVGIVTGLVLLALVCEMVPSQTVTHINLGLDL